ncbi:hypothetical protein IMZ48_13440, partial [Candidatus Bathyarchaeota archaeon]|nr:hypothetical protein [Candidatus Bathyarchaeota archaeon]
VRITSTSTIPNVGEDVVFTYFAWHVPMRNGLAITTTTGQVWLVALDEGGRIFESQLMPLLSELETWCVAISMPIDGTMESMIYAGSDDSVLRFTSIETYIITEPIEEADMARPTIKSGHTDESRDTMLWKTSYIAGPDMIVKPPATQRLMLKQHDAGVTAILPLPSPRREYGLIVTGSYDEHIRVFLMRNPHGDHIWGTAPKLLLEMKLGGGVWRLQVIKVVVGDREEGETFRCVTAEILASCMHAGPKVIRVIAHGSDSRIEMVHEFDNHELNYASHCRTRADGVVEFATTSFYDKKLHWWTWTPPELVAMGMEG